jgi:ribosomal protein S18 acetylase RimI-like enzyme
MISFKEYRQIRLAESTEHPMIEVDGVMRHRNNSLGQPIHPTDEGIKNFHRWFGDSKIVDEHGRPKVVYHGTTKDFDEFDPNLAQSEGGAFYFSHSSLYRNPATNANTYASTNRKSIDGNVMPVYIKMSNPHFSGFSEKIPTDDDKISNWLNRMDKFNRSLDETKNSYYRQEIRYARKNKHDGVIFSNIEDDRYDKIGGFPDQTDVHAVFDANQIKSALGNSGNFSSRSNKITESTELNLKHFESSLKHKYPELQRLDLMHYGDDIKLDTIVVKKEHRNSGIGGNVLDDIKHYADKHDKRVILTAGVRDPHFGTTSHSRLDKFYRRHGFVSNKGRNKDYAITATHYYKKSNVVRKHPANI